MKTIITIKTFAISCFVLFSYALKAQNETGYGKAPSTEVKLYQPATNMQTDLENTVALKKQKKKLGGFGGISFSCEIEGEKSTLHLNADSAIFVIQQGTGLLAMDISMSILLYKLEINAGKRVAVQGDYKPSLLGTGKTTDTRITFSTKQLKQGLTQLLPQTKLEKGEYAFISGTMEGNNYDGKNTKYIVYTFAID